MGLIWEYEHPPPTRFERFQSFAKSFAIFSSVISLGLILITLLVRTLLILIG